MNESDEQVNHFGRLVAYLGEYPDAQLGDLADLHDAPSDEPAALARHWCQHPDAFVEVLDDELTAPGAWDAVEELAFEHGHPVGTDWMGARTRRQLVDVGILNSLVTSPFHEEEVVLPGALATLVTPRLSDFRPSLPILLATQKEAHVRTIADQYDLSASGSRVEVMLRIMDFMSAPGSVDAIFGKLGNPDWLGVAMMVLELGGICFWQEVFGSDLGEQEDSDVVPLIPEQQRWEEQRLADRLRELGVVYRFETRDSTHPMVAVPEELWMGLWQMGRRWLIDWTSHDFQALKDQGRRGTDRRSQPDLQEVGKWLVSEAATGQLRLDDDGQQLDEATREKLRASGGDLVDDLDCYLDALFDLSVLRRGVDGFATLGAEYQKLLDMSRADFVAEALYEWCGGFLGSRVDRELPEAIGLDEQWRQQASEILRARHEFIPHWMGFEGVPQERTGAGCLRETGEASPELLSEELGLANGYVWSTKMVWLDLLAVVESGRRYPLDGLRGLVQQCASVCLFSQVGRLLDDPQAYFYLPVQRASFLEEPYYTSAFETWLDDVFTFLLEPLGVADVDREEGDVWLETDDFRVDGPPGWSDEERMMLLEEVAGEERARSAARSRSSASLRAVSGADEMAPNEIPLETPIDDILQSVRGHEIERFDGESIWLA